VAEFARETGATAVGGTTMGADPVACSALAAGFDGKAFFVRKETKAHGLQRRIEGERLRADADEQHREDVPDPLAKQTVFRATLDWSAIDKPPHSGRLDLVKRLLAARKTFVVPRLPIERVLVANVP